MPGGILFPNARTWPIWLAVKSILTSAVAIVTAVVLNRTLIPKAMFELRDLELPAPTAFLFDHHDMLPVIPVLALVISVAALMFRRLRAVLAVFATVVSLLALVVVLAALLFALMPLYQSPQDLGYPG